MSLPGNYSFTIARGKDFTIAFRKTDSATGDPFDLTGWKVRCQIRTLAGQFGTTTTTTLVLALADGAGVEIDDPTDGHITLNLTSAQTTTLNPSNTKLKLAYEIELYNDNDSPETVEGLVAGKITVTPETAR